MSGRSLLCIARPSRGRPRRNLDATKRLTPARSLQAPAMNLVWWQQPKRRMSTSSTRMGRLRVVFIDHVARYSGGEIAMLRILPSLAEHVDVHVIFGETGPLVDRLRQDRISAEVLPL